jgi:hypothetical protein
MTGGCGNKAAGEVSRSSCVRLCFRADKAVAPGFASFFGSSD